MAQSTAPDTIDDFARAVGGRWKWMLALGLLGAAIACGLTYAAKPVYQAKATLLLPNLESQTGVPAGLSGYSPVNVLRGLATSLEVQRRVASETRIPRLQIESSLSAKAELNQNQLEISATDDDPKRALSIVQSATKHLQAVASEAGLGSANRQAVILKRAIEEREDELEAANQKLAEHQRTAKTGSDPANPASALYYRQQLQLVEDSLGSVAAELNTRRKQAAASGRNPKLPSDLSGAISERTALLEAEFAYETARRQLGPDSPELQSKKRDLDEARKNFEKEVANRFRASQEGLDSQIANLEARREMLSVQRDFWNRLAGMAPKEAMQLMRLTFEVESIQTVLTGLRTRYDEAVLNSGVDSIRWSELSPPRALDEPINKNYGLNAFLGLMIGFFVGGAISIARFGS